MVTWNTMNMIYDTLTLDHMRWQLSKDTHDRMNHKCTYHRASGDMVIDVNWQNKEDKRKQPQKRKHTYGMIGWRCQEIIYITKRGPICIFVWFDLFWHGNGNMIQNNLTRSDVMCLDVVSMNLWWFGMIWERGRMTCNNRKWHEVQCVMVGKIKHKTTVKK